MYDQINLGLVGDNILEEFIERSKLQPNSFTLNLVYESKNDGPFINFIRSLYIENILILSLNFTNMSYSMCKSFSVLPLLKLKKLSLSKPRNM